ncbi:hypothetical protein Lal_00031803 [Lupinus albus]|nr:hypothetical protein Lal_00031803 [Lupinus albus]
MTIIRDIVSDFSDEEDIELIGDDEEDEDVEIGSIELHESRPYRYVGRYKYYGAGCEWHIRASVNVKHDPGIPIKALVKEIVSHFGYTVTYRKAWTANQLEISRNYGDWEGSYNEFPRWLNVVQNFAPGTIVRYEASRHFVGGIEDPTSFILDRVFLLQSM